MSHSHDAQYASPRQLIQEELRMRMRNHRRCIRAAALYATTLTDDHHGRRRRDIDFDKTIWMTWRTQWEAEQWYQILHDLQTCVHEVHAMDSAAVAAWETAWTRACHATALPGATDVVVVANPRDRNSLAKLPDSILHRLITLTLVEMISGTEDAGNHG